MAIDPDVQVLLDEINSRLDEHEGRISSIERDARLVAVEARLEEHEQRLAALEAGTPDPDPPPDDPDPPPPPPTGDHAYFDALAADSNTILARGYRNQAEIDQDLHGQPPSNNVVYDDVMDAARVFLHQDKASIQQVRPTFPVVNSGKLLFTWDYRIHEDWPANRGGVNTHKAFQLSYNADGDTRRLEPRYHYRRSTHLLTDMPEDALGWADVRRYLIGGMTVDPFDRLGPVSNEYFLYTGRWMRHWALVDFAGTFSYWIADEQTDPVLLLDAVPITPDGFNWFWLEINSSQSRTGPEVTHGHYRNLVIQRDRDPVLERP